MDAAISRRCDVCHAAIEGRRRQAKHCSPACARASYAARHLPALRAAVVYLQREIARLENQLSGARRRTSG